MKNPEIKLTFTADASQADKEIDKIEKKVEQLPKRIPLGQGRWTPNPADPVQEKYLENYKKMQGDIYALSQEYDNLLNQTEKVATAYRNELAALDETAQGYAEKKQTLETLIEKGKALEKSLQSNKNAVEKQGEALEELNRKAERVGYQKAIKEQEKLGISNASLSKALELSEVRIERYANAWNNKLIKNQEQAIKTEQKYNVALNTTGKTYQELVELYSKLLAARNKAKLPEQLSSIDKQLTAVRTNIRLMGRETQLTGAKIIGAQKNIFGVFETCVELWRNGILTLRGLTQGIKLFAKSTLVLAAIQFAWEGISWALDKAKTAFFGTAKAEKEAAEKAKELSEAAKDANAELQKAQETLAAWRADKIRAETAKEYAAAIQEQNDLFSEQIRIVDEATSALLRLNLAMAKEEEAAIALERLKIQEQRMKGLIDEYEYQEAIIDLEARAADIKRNANIEAKALTMKGKSEQITEARNAYNESLLMATESMAGYELSPDEVKVQIATYKDLKATIEQYRKKYTALKVEENKWKTLSEKYGEQYKKDPTDIHALSIYEGAIANLKSIQNYEMWEEQMQQAYRDIPEIVRKYGLSGIGLSQYTKEQKARTDYNAAVEEQQKRLKEELDTRQAEYMKAQADWEDATDTARDAAAQQKELNEQRIKNIHTQRDIEKSRIENEKRIQEAIKEVEKLEYSALKQEAGKMREWASKAGEHTPEGKNRQALANVYIKEYEKRRTAGMQASAMVKEVGENATTRKEQEIIEKARALAYKAGTGKDVKLDEISALLDKALKTRGEADNAAVTMLYNIVDKNLKKTGKNAFKNRALEQRIKAMTNAYADK